MSSHSLWKWIVEELDRGCLGCFLGVRKLAHGCLKAMLGRSPASPLGPNIPRLRSTDGTCTGADLGFGRSYRTNEYEITITPLVDVLLSRLPQYLY